MSALINPFGALVGAADVLANATFSGKKFGFASVVLVGTVYTLTLDPTHQVDPANSCIHSNFLGTLSDIGLNVVQTSDTTIEVRPITSGGVATVAAFSLLVFRKGIG